jgi:hypothetical protein
MRSRNYALRAASRPPLRRQLSRSSLLPRFPAAARQSATCSLPPLAISPTGPSCAAGVGCTCSPRNRMNSYAEGAANPCGMRTSKIIGLKVSCNQHLQKSGGPWRTPVSHLRSLIPASDKTITLAFPAASALFVRSFAQERKSTPFFSGVSARFCRNGGITHLPQNNLKVILEVSQSAELQQSSGKGKLAP